MAGRRPTRRFAGIAVLAAIAIPIALGAAGCGDSDETASTGATTALSVVVEPAQAVPGDEIAARVVNESDREYAYGADYELERRAGSGWQRVKLPPHAVIQIAYIAEPGATGPPVAAEVPKDAAPGRWRVVIDRDAPGTGLLAGEFEVVGE